MNGAEKTRKRILYVLNGVIGGANNSALDIISNLPADRYVGCIAYPRYLSQHEALFHSASDFVRPLDLGDWIWYRRNLPRWRLPQTWLTSSFRPVFQWKSVHMLVRLCREWKIDLIHTNTSTTLSPSIAARICRLPHVWHIREIVGKNGAFAYPPGDRLAAQVFFHLSDKIIANSEQTAAYFYSHLSSATERVEIIPNGIPAAPTDIQQRGDRLRDDLHIPRDAIVVAMVANFTALKRHFLFLEAAGSVAQKRPNVWVIFFGKYDDSKYVQSVRQQVEALTLGNRIIFAGYISDIWSAMGALDILGHGTHQESFGRIFVEAMLAGKPVVTPRGGGALSIVVHGSTGYLTEPEDVASLEKYLLRLVDDPLLAKEMGANGMHRASERFGIESSVCRIYNVYDTVLAYKSNSQR